MLSRSIICILAVVFVQLACQGGESPPPVVEDDAGGETAPPANPLAGTRWRLVEFQSMDDATGTIAPDDPQRYTMTLAADGTVAMVLSCNRATGTWSAEPGADGTTGSFRFGPLATTRALCPPPTMDERIARDAEFVTGYLLRDGRLFLSLMADGGIYAWEPSEDEAFERTPDPVLEAAIREATPSYTREVVDAGGATGAGRYVYSRVDLNGDGRDETLAYLLGPFFCGSGGCDLLLLTTDAQGAYSLVGEFPISRTPVIVSPRQTNGWRDLVRLESGGGAPASHVRHTFDGQRYVEQERTSAERMPEGRQVLADGVTFEAGIPLEPRS